MCSFETPAVACSIAEGVNTPGADDLLLFDAFALPLPSTSGDASGSEAGEFMRWDQQHYGFFAPQV